MKKRADLDTSYETDRRNQAALLRVVWEGDWDRGRRHSARLTRPYGEMVLTEIKARFNSGSPEKVLNDKGEQVDGPEFSRWNQLSSVAPLGLNPLQSAVGPQLLHYRLPIEITGGITGPTWDWFRRVSGLDDALKRRHTLATALGSAIIRPCLKLVPWAEGTYHPPGYVVVPPDMAIGIPDPSDPSRLCAYLELQTDKDALGKWMVWDLTNPSNPKWGLWQSPDAWAGGQRWLKGVEGDSYPWRWRGEPRVPAAVEKSITTTDEALPIHKGVRQDCLDIVMAATWAAHVQQQQSHNRLNIFSKLELDGLETWSNDPSSVNTAWNAEGVSMSTVPHGLDAVEKLNAFLGDRLERFFKDFNPRLEMTRAEGVKSGVALQIELTGHVQAAQDAESRISGPDADAIRFGVGILNALNRAGQIGLKSDGITVNWDPEGAGLFRPDLLIPEKDFETRYSIRWNTVEKARRREEIERDIAMGIETPEALYLLDHNLADDRPDGANWKAAEQFIEASAQRNLTLAAMGVGLSPRERYLLTVDTVVDETERHIPPADVADTASKGLNLYADTRRGLDQRKTARGRALHARGRSLQGREPMTVGEVRNLNTWLRQHENDGDREQEIGEWGNDEDPSGRWVEWLTQGGQEALEWSGLLLAEPLEVGEEESGDIS